SWTSLGVTALWWVVAGAWAARAARTDWRMMAGMFEGLICAAGVVVGLVVSAAIATVGIFYRGRYRWHSAWALVACLLAGAAPFLYWAACDLWPKPVRDNPTGPAPAHGDML